MTEYLKVKAVNGTKDLYIRLIPVTGGYNIKIAKTTGIFDFETTENPASGDKVWDASNASPPPPLTIEHMDEDGKIPVKSQTI